MFDADPEKYLNAKINATHYALSWISHMKYTTWVTRTRKLWIWIHLCLAIVGGILVVAIALSGSAISFMDEIDQILNPHLHQATGPKLFSIEQMRTQVEQHFPGESVVSILLPRTKISHHPLATYEFLVQSANGNSRREV